jgi:hypothetical protein
VKLGPTSPVETRVVGWSFCGPLSPSISGIGAAAAIIGNYSRDKTGRRAATKSPAAQEGDLGRGARIGRARTWGAIKRARQSNTTDCSRQTHRPPSPQKSPAGPGRVDRGAKMGALGLGGKFKRAQQSNAATAGLFPTPQNKRPPSRPDGRMRCQGSWRMVPSTHAREPLVPSSSDTKKAPPEQGPERGKEERAFARGAKERRAPK